MGELLGRQPTPLGEVIAQVGHAAVVAGDVGVHLHAVAGRHDGGLQHVLALGHRRQRLGMQVRRDRKAFQHVHWGGAVADAEYEEGHR